jgi:hypothetical protein
LIDDSMNEYLQKKIDEMLDENHNKPIEKDWDGYLDSILW